MCLDRDEWEFTGTVSSLFAIHTFNKNNVMSSSLVNSISPKRYPVWLYIPLNSFLT